MKNSLKINSRETKTGETNMPILQRILQKASTTFALLMAPLLFSLLCVFIVQPTPVLAAPTIPYKINFQGRLTDNNGNIVADGLYNVKFSIFNADSGGTQFWQEFRQTTNRVQITNGLFDVRFGDITALTPSLFNSSTQLYLQVELPTPATATCATSNCGSFTEGPLGPRQPIAATPYAFNADTVDGIDGSSLARNDTANTFTGNQTVNGALTATSIIFGSSTVCHIGNNCSYAAASGSGSYIQNGASAQTANFNITGNGTIGGVATLSGAASLGSTLTVTGATTFNSNVTMGAGDKTQYALEVGDKVYYYSNTFGRGVESSTLTDWTSSRYRIRVGGTSVSTGTEKLTVTSVGLKVGGGDATQALDVAGNGLFSGSVTASSFSGSGANLTSLNAANLTGTIADARISGSYTGLTNLTGTGTVDFSRFLGNAADTAAAPSYSWSGDLNTGIYQPAADMVGISTGGGERLRVTSAGVGIGGINPTKSIDVSGNARFTGSIQGGNAAVKTWTNLATYTSSAATTGAIVIETNMPLTTNTMFKVGIDGYMYDATAPFKIEAGGYAYNGASFVNPGYTNYGGLKSSVRFAKNAAGNVVIIIGETTDTFQYPKIAVTSFMIGHSNLLDSYGDGWTTSQKTDISAYSALTSVPDKTSIAASSIQAGTFAGNFTYTGTATFNSTVNIGAGSLIDFSDTAGDKALYFSNQYGRGIETATLTDWTGTRYRIRVGGTNVSSGTEKLTVTSVGLKIGGGDATQALDVAGNVDITGTYKINGSDICNSSGCTAAGGSSSYIQNGTSVQTANFAIQSAVGSSIGAVVRAASTQTADLLQLQNLGGTAIAGIRADGRVYGANGSAAEDYATIAQLQMLPSYAHINGGNSFGAISVLGTTDNFALSVVTNSVERLSISNAGAAQFTGTLGVSGAATLSSTLAVTGASSLTGAVTLGTQGTATTHAVRADRTITAGNGLTGGGNLTANRSLAVGQGDGITVGATTVGVDATVCRNTNNCGYAAASGSASYIQNGTVDQSGNFAIQSPSPTSVVGVVKGASGQTADLMRFVNGSTTLGITAAGDLQSSDTLSLYVEGMASPHVSFGQAFSVPISSFNTLTLFNSPHAAVVPLAIKGASSQTANLLELKSSADVVYVSVSATGVLNVKSASGSASMIVRDSSNDIIFQIGSDNKFTLGNGGQSFGSIKRTTFNWDPPSTANVSTSAALINITGIPADAALIAITPPSPAACGGFGCEYSWGGSSTLAVADPTAASTSAFLNPTMGKMFGTSNPLRTIRVYFSNASGSTNNPGDSTWQVWYIEP